MFHSFIIIQTQRLGNDTRLLLTRLGKLGLDPAHIVGQDEVGYRSFYTAEQVSVTAWHARRFHLLISSFLCNAEGVKSPVRHGAGFLVSLGKAGLRTESLTSIE